MKKTITISCVLACLISLSTSCYTYVSFQKSYPPEITLDQQKNSIAFINTFNYTIPDEDPKNEDDVYQAGVTEVINGLKKSFAGNDQIDFLVVDTLMQEESLYTFSDTLNAETVQNICRENNASMLLVLDYLNIGIESETEENEEGSFFRTTANYYLNVTTGLSLYSGSGNLINRSSVGRYELYKSRGAIAGFAIFDPSIYKAEKDIRYLAGFLGNDYLEKFYPKNTNVNRKIYSGSGLTEVVRYCRINEWDKAIELLKPLAASPDPELAGKAAYNLSVAYEAIGDDKTSEFWLQKSGKYNSKNPVIHF